MRALTEPIRLKGPVVHGFGRGSKSLGIPTANLEAESLKCELQDAPNGVYFGWASVGASTAVYKFVMSVGWNPFFNNEKKTVEPHLLHVFERDFYGEELRLVVVAYLRPELKPPSLDALIAAIRLDIDTASRLLDAEPYRRAQADAFLLPAR